MIELQSDAACELMLLKSTSLLVAIQGNAWILWGKSWTKGTH